MSDCEQCAALRAEIERLKEQLESPFMDGYETAKEEYRPLLIAAEAEVERLTAERDRQYDQNAEQITRIAALEAENSSLSSWQCVYTDGKTGLVGDEHGNQYCAMAKRFEALRAENEKLRAALKPFADESLWCGLQHEFVAVKRSDCDRARAALEEK